MGSEDRSMLDDVIDAVGAYVSDTRKSEKLREALVDPIIEQLARRFAMLFRAVQGVAILIVIQFVFVAWLLVRSYRR